MSDLIERCFRLALEEADTLHIYRSDFRDQLPIAGEKSPGCRKRHPMIVEVEAVSHYVKPFRLGEKCLFRGQKGGIDLAGSKRLHALVVDAEIDKREIALS